MASTKMAHVTTRSRLLKLAVIGDKQVGKTSLISRFTNDSFSPHYTYTIGGDMQEIDVTINNVKVNVTLVDAAGHQYVRSLIKSLYRDVHAVMVVFDLTRLNTFESVHDWLQQIEWVNTNNPVIFLVGNKEDMTSYRSVHNEQAEIKSQRCGIPYYETSAKTGYNVHHTFDHLLRTAWQHVMPIYIPMEKIVLSTTESHAKDDHSCCSIL